MIPAPRFKTSIAIFDHRKCRDLATQKAPAGRGHASQGTPGLPGGLLTSPSPSLSLSLSVCPAASLSGLPSGVTLTLWSGKVDDPFLRATQEVC